MSHFQARRAVVVALALVVAGIISECVATDAALAQAPTADTFRDPALRTGMLPNGMRYYVRENQMPAGRAYLWLAVNAGSVLEDEDQRGYAHFLEHMAFNGTTRFPQHEIIDFIESSGMRFGADLNAYTSYDETVYTLTVPTDTAGVVERALDVLEDWASGGITLDSAEVVAERGVVLGEWRTRALRDSVSDRLQEHELDVMFGGSNYRHRLPIGLPESIESAMPEPLRRFYEDWYRPDLMAVVAVGDFDVEWMEREIQARFGTIEPAVEARPRPEPEIAASEAPVVDILRDKVSPRVDLLWRAPERPREAAAAVRHDLVSELLAQHVQRKLLRIRERESRPFVHAVLGRQRPVRPMDLVAARVVAWPDSLEPALGAVLTELERVAQHGIPAATLEHRKAALVRRFEHEAASAAARPSADYAREYVQHHLTGEGTLLSPDQRLALAREILPQITPEWLARAAQFWRQRKGLKLLVRVPRFALGFRPPTETSVLALFDSIQGAPLAPDSAPAIVADGPLIDRPPEPGAVVEERRHETAGTTEWRLSNGARVLFKPSQNHPDELLLRAWSPGGFSRLPDSLFFSSGRMVGPILTEAAGLGERDRDDVTDRLATTGVRELRVDIGYAKETIELAGSPRELETLFQMLYLQFTAPNLDSATLVTWANVAKYQRRGGSIHDALNQTFARGNPRLLPVQTHMAELVRVEEALAVHRDRFGNAGDFTFLMVGAAEPEEVKPLVAQYIASLPATDVREAPADPDVRPFVGRIEPLRKVPYPRAQAVRVFDGAFPTEPDAYFRERQRLDALTLVLERRLRDRLREQLSATYGAPVTSHTYRLYEEHFRVLMAFQSAPERLRELTREMQSILDSVRTQGATSAELAIVSRIQQRQFETRLQSNEFWLNQLELYSRLDLPLDRIVSPYTAEPLSPAELKAAAARYLPADSFIHLTEMPSDTAQVSSKANK